MPTITDEEREIMGWASDAFKKPWFDICDMVQRIHGGEKMSIKDSMIEAMLSPVPIPGRILYRAMQLGAAKVALGNNVNMLTIILNKQGDEVVWSCIENGEKGVYTEYHELNDRLDEDWFKEVGSLLSEDRLEDAFELCKDSLAEQPDVSHIELGLIKVAHLQFFDAMKTAWEEANDGAKLALMGVKMADAVREIMDEGWLRFYPNVNLGKALKLMMPALGALQPLNSGLQKALAKLPF